MAQALHKDIVGMLLEREVFLNSAQVQQLQSSSEQQLHTVKEKILQGTTDPGKLFLTEASSTSVTVVQSYTEEMIKKREVKDFSQYFRHRYKQLSEMLKGRAELQRALSIRRVKEKQESERVAFIGIIADKRETLNGHIMLTLEDLTDSIKVLISKNSGDLFTEAKDLLFDETIGIIGTNKEDIVFAQQICWPDIPKHGELKKSPDDTHAIFLSDVHVGSTYFLGEKFQRFLSWLNGKDVPEEHADIVPKIKYLFIIGDLVDGVGIYPGQEKELSIPDIYGQYEEAARYLEQIPPHIQIIICTGNHDAVRLSEPQPALSEALAPRICDMPNVTLVTNPSVVRIHESPGFPGFEVLLYHGYSFDYIVSQVDSIRNNGGYHRADLVMKYLLKRRHVCPAHTSSLYIPDVTQDPLVIKSVPDFFVSGHIHYTSVSQYHHVTLICGSCWQDQTAFQLKVGHDPEPARVPLVNLQTRNVKILRF